MFNSFLLTRFDCIWPVYKLYLSCTVKTVYNNTIGSPVLCCYNQVVVVTSTFCTETSETVPNMCVVVERVMLYPVTL